MQHPAVEQGFRRRYAVDDLLNPFLLSVVLLQTVAEDFDFLYRIGSGKFGGCNRVFRSFHITAVILNHKLVFIGKTAGAVVIAVGKDGIFTDEMAGQVRTHRYGCNTESIRGCGVALIVVTDFFHRRDVVLFG